MDPRQTDVKKKREKGKEKVYNHEGEKKKKKKDIAWGCRASNKFSDFGWSSKNRPQCLQDNLWCGTNCIWNGYQANYFSDPVSLSKFFKKIFLSNLTF